MRRKWLPVAVELMMDLLANPDKWGWVSQCGIPSDARIVDALWDGRTLMLMLESKTFPETQSGEIFPSMEAIYKRERPIYDGNPTDRI